jgi:hypothetical protein
VNLLLISHQNGALGQSLLWCTTASTSKEFRLLAVATTEILDRDVSRRQALKKTIRTLEDSISIHRLFSKVDDPLVSSANITLQEYTRRSYDRFDWPRAGLQHDQLMLNTFIPFPQVALVFINIEPLSSSPIVSFWSPRIHLESMQFRCLA